MKDYKLGMYEKAMPGNLTWKEKLETAKSAEFDFVEISIDETDAKLARLESSAEERLALVKCMKEVQLPIRSMCLSGHRRFPIGSSDPDICHKGMEIMERAIQFADDIGIRIIQLAGYDVYYEESNAGTVKRFEENLEKSVEIASKYGVVLGFETMETEFMNTVEKAMKYVNQIESPYLGVYPDVGNITNAAQLYGTRVVDDMETGRGHIQAMHLKESLPGVFREVPFGTGHVDFPEVIKKGWDMGVRRYTAEFWYVNNDDWYEVSRDASKKMRTILDTMKERMKTC